ncbi:DMT family transporter [Vibrio atypicus]|uniref:DMT family transporter n=1 Tax=Vibrio atypicus TaxID=558271 RepID=UPI001359C734|nr:DMT family transporter [Vibrio atypicus]
MSAYHLAILLLVFGNFTASLSDVAVKLLNGDVPTFQYVLLRQLLSLALIFPLWFRQKPSARKLYRPGLNLFRAHLILIGSGCMVVAITHLPLATANAVFYAAPLLMLPLSILLLKETPSATKIAASLVGFLGVLVVLRPSEFHWAALFALGTAITLALFNVTARKLPAQQTVISTLFWTTLLSLPVASVLALSVWKPLNAQELLLILASASLILAYNGVAVAAYKKAPAGNIAVAENSGLLFVTLFGVMWFNEVPDWLTIVGIVMIVVPLIPWRNLKPIKRHARVLDE